MQAKDSDGTVTPLMFRGEHYVYAVFCQDKTGPLYVKFGKSSHLRRRLACLITATPIPTQYFAFIEVLTPEIQAEVERNLHRRFAERRVVGEWFQFDSKSADDKEDFHDGCVEVFLATIGPGVSWTKIKATDLPAISAASMEAKKNHTFWCGIMHMNAKFDRQR